MFTRLTPWQGFTHSHQITDAVKSGKRNPIPDQCPLIDIINQCWVILKKTQNPDSLK